MTANHRPLEEADVDLIDRVRATPCLYDTRDPNFRLVYKKEQEWQNVADRLSIPHWEARKRWTVLRDRYARELKQLLLHPDSAEYGKNDFFLRMDFIRSFVKKREVKRKRNSSSCVELNDDSNPRPLKLHKVDSDASNIESDDNLISLEKSYTIDDSQHSSAGKFSYIEQVSQDPIEHQELHEHINSMDRQCDEQEFSDYVEGSVYESVEDDHDALTHESNDYILSSSINSNKNVKTKPKSAKIADSFSTSALESESLSTLPHLQQRPVIKNVCTESALANTPPDTECFFSKTLASYLRQLSPRHKIKAKIEMMQIIEKYLNLEENS